MGLIKAVVLLLAVIWVQALIPPFSAASEKSNNLFSISLAQLAQVKVTTPSKTALALNESPGIVTVYSAREITLFGGRDLGEVLSRVPGFQEYGTLENGRNKISIRSDQASTNNSHVLILLNGTPLNRESYAQGIWNEAMLLAIPLRIISQIEVTRGPGSVLYGTNALAGVINIVTKQGDDLSNRVALSYGRFNTRKAEVDVGLNVRDWRWNTSVSLSETDGWPFEMNDANNEPFKDDAWSKNPGILSTLTKGQFYASAYWGNADQFTIRGPSDGLAAGFTDNSKYMLEAAYTAEFESGWDLKTSFSHVGGDTDHAIVLATGLGVLTYKSRDYRLESTASGSLDNGVTWVMGATADLLSGEASTIEDWDQHLLGVYGQLTYNVGSTNYLVGAQFNRAQDGYRRWVPRLGVIHQFSKAWGVKLLYGQAFRAPSALERKIQVAIPTLTLKGEPDLDPEIVTNWDAQVFYNNAGSSFSLSIFRAEEEDLIIRDVIVPGNVKFANKGKLVVQGAEMEFKTTYGDHWYFTGNYSYQQNHDDNGFDNYTLLPRQSIKMGIGYTAENWSVGMFDSWTDDYYSNKLFYPTVNKTNPRAHRHHRLSANIVYAPKRLRGWSVSAYFDNLLNEDLYLPIQPGGLHFDINTTPVMAGRYYQLSIEKTF
ncbi:MAG: TonB-dependent receptor [Halieaceae bacterium]|jgi:outer membrane receptor for ferrienterochelin and colicins|nr:TonB-dependent receptor [Halieaceae bacterium]